MPVRYTRQSPTRVYSFLLSRILALFLSDTLRLYDLYVEPAIYPSFSQPSLLECQREQARSKSTLIIAEEMQLYATCRLSYSAVNGWDFLRAVHEPVLGASKNDTVLVILTYLGTSGMLMAVKCEIYCIVAVSNMGIVEHDDPQK
jgi:hypothetical protein